MQSGLIKRIVIFTLFFNIHINAQFKDDFERYNYSQRISPQSLNWITWSEDPETGTGYIEDEDGIISNTDYPNYGESQHVAFSGKQALFIGKNNLGSQPQDVVLDLHNKSTGLWNLEWEMYVSKRNRAYYNFQENTPINGLGNWAIQVYFNKNGRGTIENDIGDKIINFKYPVNEWFKIKHIIDLDNDSIKIEIIKSSGSIVIYDDQFLSNNQHVGGVNFYSIDKKNKYYIDDVVFEKTLPIKDVFIWLNNQWEDLDGNILSGEPDSSYEVILREPFTVGVNGSGKTLTCLNLVFENSGKLIIPKQTNVVVSGNLEVPAGNNIIVEDGGSFVMLNNTATINMPDPDSFEYTRISTEMTNTYDFTYWSSPIIDANVSVFESSSIYEYNTANYIDLFSGKGYPQTSGVPDKHDDDGDDWLILKNTDKVISGKGYAVLSPGNSSGKIINFKGLPNNGFISVPVSLSGDNSNDNDDWNLIGNPYPSAIDATILINSNINLSGTLYFWTHNTKIGGGNNDGPSDSNFDVNDYASFNLSGGVAAISGGEIPNGFIAAGQGFFMEVNNNGVVTFNNDMRVINVVNENTQFYKNTDDKDKIVKNDDKVDENRIWLSFSNNNGAYSQSLIAFLPEATNNFEGKYDGIRAGTELRSKFYSILDEKELAIQGRSVMLENVQIPLGFYIAKPESFTISIDQLEGFKFENSTEIYLTDHKLNKTHNLKVSDYQFDVTKSGKNNTRFTIQFENPDLDTEIINTAEDLIITNSISAFKIKSNQVIKIIKVFDIMGRLLISDEPNRRDFYLRNSNIKKGSIVLINAEMENGNIINKKMIKF